MIYLLKQIHKLNKSQLQDLAEKLEIIKERKIKDEGMPPYANPYTHLRLSDIKEALTYCIYHFKGGGFYESMGEECPCNCRCQACEMIPETLIPKRMQELCATMTEENVFDEFKRQYGRQDELQPQIRTIRSSCYTNTTISYCRC